MNPSSPHSENAPAVIAPKDGSADALTADASAPERAFLTHDGFPKEKWLRLLLVTTTCLVLLLAVGVSIRLLALIGHTLLLFALGGLLAYALDPLVERARSFTGGKRGPRWFGALIVFGLLFAVLIVGAVLLSEELARQVQILARDHAQ